jgi:hypothetical protein
MEFEIFESESKNVRASGYKKQGNRFIILKGSYAVDDSMLKKSFFGHTKSYESIRNDLINTGKLKKISDKYQFTVDVEFNSPSQAACIVWGCNLNGPKVFGIDENNLKDKITHKLFFELDSEKAIEGYKQDKQLISTVRDRGIVKARKEKDNHTCLACGYKMEINGKFIIECHHLEPISLGIRETTIDDLVSLCPTCHRIVHMRQPIYSILEVQALINKI